MIIQWYFAFTFRCNLVRAIIQIVYAHVLSQNIIKSYGLKAEPENIHLLSFTSAYYNKYGTLGFLLFPCGGNNGGINYTCIPTVYQNSSTSLISSLAVIYYISRIFIWFVLREYSNKLKLPQYNKWHTLK